MICNLIIKQVFLKMTLVKEEKKLFAHSPLSTLENKETEKPEGEFTFAFIFACACSIYKSFQSRVDMIH